MLKKAVALHSSFRDSFEIVEYETKWRDFSITKEQGIAIATAKLHGRTNAFTVNMSVIEGCRLL